MKKVVGIACDNYKVDKFSDQLEKAGFKYNIIPLGTKNSTIRVTFESDEMQKLKSIIQEVNNYFVAKKN